MRAHRRLILCALISATVGLISGCSSIHVDAERSESEHVDVADRLETAQSYRWKSIPVLLGGDFEDATGFRDRVVSAFDARFESFGLAREAKMKTDLVLSVSASITDRDYVGDPFYANYHIRRFEEGTLKLKVTDRLTGEVLWSGAADRNIRFTATEVGLFSAGKYVENSNPRDWRLEEMVDAIANRFRTELGHR